MNKNDQNVKSTKSIPEILEIEDQEIEEKKPPNNRIIDYKIVKDDDKTEMEI